MSSQGKKIRAICSIVATYAILASTLYLTCRYRLSFIESISTYYYDSHLTGAMLRKPGGLAIILSQLLTQFYGSVWAAVSISAAVLTASAVLTDYVLARITKRVTLYPISLIPSLALCIVQPDIYCQYSYTVSFVLMLTALALTVSLHHERTRLAIAMLMTLLLMHAAGAITTVYAVSISLIEITERPKRPGAWMYALTIALVVVLSEVGVLTGVFGNMAQGMLPAGYYTPWLTAPRSLYWPWTAFVLVIAGGCILSKCGNISVRGHRIVAAAECALTICAGIYLYAEYDRPADEMYARMMLSAGRHDWLAISDSYQQAPPDDRRLRNLYNLSLAERGQLGKVLFQQPCTGTETVLDTSSKHPDSYMLLGDIYYSMGHMSLALKHTFEANEGLGNYSPRLLKRLVDINLVTGQYAVADKYLKLLSKTLMYDDWAAQRRKLLYDDDAVCAHDDLGDKRRCLFAADRFTGSQGIESDLTEILRAHPEHSVTMEYLGALTLLSKNVPLFTAIANEFYGTAAMPSPLPKHYQEAIAIATLASGERLDQRYNLHPSTVQRCQDFWAKRQDQPGTFWHYLKFGDK